MKKYVCFLGHEVVIIKDGTRACGSGGVLGNAPLVQSKSYFEVKLQQSGMRSCNHFTKLYHGRRKYYCS